MFARPLGEVIEELRRDDQGEQVLVGQVNRIRFNERCDLALGPAQWDEFVEFVSGCSDWPERAMLLRYYWSWKDGDPARLLPTPAEIERLAEGND